MKLVIHPTATADIRIPAAHIVVSLRADGMYELCVNVDPEIEVTAAPVDPEIEGDGDLEIETSVDPEGQPSGWLFEIAGEDNDEVERQYLLHLIAHEAASRLTSAQAAQQQGKPWTCPRCESTNSADLTVCEICDEQI